MGSWEVKVIRLRRVHIRRFRSLEPDTRLEFGPGHVFILGKNGSGKTTLLELLAKLVSCDLASFREEEEEVDLEWELDTDMLGAGGDLDRHHLSLTLQLDPRPQRADMHTSDNTMTATVLQMPRPSPKWNLSLEYSVSQPDGNPNLARQNPTAHDAVSTLNVQLASDREPSVEPPPPMGANLKLLQLSPLEDLFMTRLSNALLKCFSEASSTWRMDQHSPILQFFGLSNLLRASLSRFDEALAAFGQIAGLLEPSSNSLQAAMIYAEGGIHVAHFVPFGVHIKTVHEAGQVAPDSFSHALLAAPAEVAYRALLSRLQEALGAESIEINPRLLSEDGRGRRTWRGFDIYVRWPGGLKHRHDQLSFGQKRLIAFLWYADVFQNLPLITDELTNGMHASWVRSIVDLLQDRQAFHAIQNPLLLDMVGPGTEAEIPGRFVFCEMGTGKQGTTWRWRNPTAEEARRLRAAWEAGFQHLSEVLQSEGLW